MNCCNSDEYNRALFLVTLNERSLSGSCLMLLVLRPNASSVLAKETVNETSTSITRDFHTNRCL